MVTQKISDIDVKKLKHAKGVMAVLELLGLTEEDLLLLKEIPNMKAELEELREFKAKVNRTLDNKVDNANVKTPSELIKDSFNSPVKEFNPHYE